MMRPAPIPSYYYPVARPERARTGAALLLVVIGACLVVAIAMTVLAVLLARPGPSTGCLANCTRHPVSRPLGPQLVYRSAAVGYALEYWDPLPSSYRGTRVSVKDDRSLGWEIPSSTAAWPATISGDSARGRSADRLVADLVGSKLPGAALVFTIPNATVGAVNPAYAGVYDGRLAVAGGKEIRVRALAVAAVKNGVAVTYLAIGPYDDRSVNYPTVADTQVLAAFDPVLNTVVFPGDAFI